MRPLTTAVCAALLAACGAAQNPIARYEYVEQTAPFSDPTGAAAWLTALNRPSTMAGGLRLEIAWSAGVAGPRQYFLLTGFDPAWTMLGPTWCNGWLMLDPLVAVPISAPTPGNPTVIHMPIPIQAAVFGTIVRQQGLYIIPSGWMSLSRLGIATCGIA